MRRVLIIGDRGEGTRTLARNLKDAGYEVHAAASGREGLRFLQSLRPDIVMLELEAPAEGATVLAEIRSWSPIPLIALSSVGDATAVVALLDAGADDFLSVPYDFEELLARMNGVFRRTLPESLGSRIELGDICIDLYAHSVTAGGREVALTPTEYAILACLARNRGKVVTQARLLAELWGRHASERQGSLRVHILSLRRKLEKDASRPEILITEPGVGHILVDHLPALK